MQNNNRHNNNQRSKPEITPEYLEELNNEYATKLAYKNRQKINKSKMNMDDNTFINNVIEEERQKSQKQKIQKQKIQKQKNQNKKIKSKKLKGSNKSNNYPSINDINENLNDTYNISTLERIKKQREKIINNVYKNILTDEFPKNIENKERALQKLDEYQYIQDITNLTRMRYIRYFTKDKSGNTYLASGGIFNKLINDKILLCQFSTNSFWSIPSDSIIFKKMNDDEKLQCAICEVIQNKEKNNN